MDENTDTQQHRQATLTVTLITGLDTCQVCHLRLIGDEMATCEPCIRLMATRALPRGDEHQILRSAFAVGPEGERPSVTIICDDGAHAGSWGLHTVSARWSAAERARMKRRLLERRLSPAREHAAAVPKRGWVISLHGIVTGFLVAWPDAREREAADRG
jgi:hypothetical protein